MFKFHPIIDTIHSQSRLCFCYANADLILLLRFQIQLITKGCVWSAGFACAGKQSLHSSQVGGASRPFLVSNNAENFDAQNELLVIAWILKWCAVRTLQNCQINFERVTNV
ncbi:MAG: hypothetical protein WAW41_12195 [Methylobacter sp.]